MKKIILFFFVAFIGFAVNAQEFQLHEASSKLREKVTLTNENPNVVIDYSQLSFSDAEFIKETSPTRAITTFPWKESFTNATPFPPTEWTRTQVSGTGNWVHSAAAPLWDGGCAFRNYTTTGTQNTWLITPQIVMPASGNMALVFRSYMGDPSFYGTSKIYISTTTNTAPGAFTEVYFLQGAEVSSAWSRIAVDLTPYYNQSIYIAFVYTGTDAHSWRIDDVEVLNLPDNDLSISAIYPYTQVPSTQPMFSSLSATVNNIGSSAQTNVVATAQMNGTTIGTAAALPTLAAGASENVNIPITNTTIPFGNNVLTYNVTQTQTDANPADNTITRAVTGSKNTFATETGGFTSLWTGTATARYGNIFTFTQPTTVSQIQAHFHQNGTASTYGIAIHEVTAPNTISATALVSQSGLSKPASTTAWSTANITTPILLQPGSYYVSVTGANIGILGETNGEGRVGYSATTTATALTPLTAAICVRIKVDPYQNDLEALANGFLYTKVPSFQSGLIPFPATAARAVNAGLAAQTNVKTTVTLGATPIGVSPVIASLAPLTTSALMTVPAPAATFLPTALGTYNVNYNVSSDQTDEYPSDNTQTYSFEITDGLYAIDGVGTSNFAGVGYTTAGNALGNFFTITKATQLNQVLLGFSASPTGVQNYNIIVCRRNGLTLTGTPTVIATAYRDAPEAWITLNVTPTVLLPGDYFLGVQQSTTANIGLAYDGVPGRVCYGYTGVPGLVEQTTFGSLALRMVLEDITTVTVTTAVSPAGTGSVTGGGVYAHGATVTLTATPAFGYDFVEWSNGETANPYTFTVTEDITLTALFGEVNYCEDKIVGTGTSIVNYSPINTYWNYSYSQQIYSADAIGKTGEIKSVAFEYIHTTPYNAVDVKIYMGITNKNTFTNAQDLIPFSELQLVYSGPATFNNTNQWSKINLDTPFPYTCGNLVVAVLNNQGSNLGTSVGTFRVTTPTPTGNYAITYYHDSGGPINPAAPTASNMLAYNIRPNMKFEVCDVMACNDKQIGNGTTAVRTHPIDYYFNRSYVQQIFLASEIGVPAGAITSLSFQYTTDYPTNSRANQTIYVGNTTKASFGGTTAAEWIPASQLTEVYSGTISMTPGWVTITFNNAFEYTGGNLVVAFLNLDGVYTGLSGDNRYLAHSTAPDNRVLRWNSDSSFPGITAPPAASARETSRNNIIFNICAIQPMVEMEAVSITGPTMIPALDPATYTVTVRNNAGSAANNYTVNVLTAANELLGTTTVTTPLAPGTTATVTVPFAFPIAMIGAQNIKGQVVINCDANLANNETPLFAVQVLSECASDPAVAIIGTATTTSSAMPFNFNWGNCMVQSIYHANEIGLEPGTEISQIRYKYNVTTALTNPKPISVRMANTTQNNYASTSAWIPFSQFELVYTGTITLPVASPHEIILTLDQPFVYTGGNLCIATYKEMNTTNYTAPGGHATTMTPSDRTIYYQSDGTLFNMTSPQVGTRSSMVPNIQILSMGIKEFTVDYEVLGGGYVNVVLSPDPLICGETGTVTITPADDCTQISGIKFDGVPQPIQTTYEFPNQNVPLPFITIETLFPHYTITSTAGANGTIDPNGTITYPCGHDTTYHFLPLNGYMVDYFELDGVVMPRTGNYRFSRILDNHNIHVEFKEAPLTISWTFAGDGKVIPVGYEALADSLQLGVDLGTNQQFLFIPEDNWEIQAVYINGVSNPIALINGAYWFTNIQSNHHIHVVFKLRDIVIYAQAGANGNITPNGTVLVPYGTNQTFTIQANSGYVIDQLLVNGAPEPVGYEVGYFQYTFEEVIESHTIFVAFKRATWTVVVTACEGGTVDPVGNVQLQHHQTQIFTFLPLEGYRVSSVIVDGVSFPPAIQTGSYTFYTIESNHTLDVCFEKIPYPITALVNSNCVITAQINGGAIIAGEGVTNVDHGDKIRYIFTPRPGYKLVNVFVDGFDDLAAVAAGEYTFVNVTAPHVISAVVALKTYTINASVRGTGGFINPAGTIAANHGENKFFTFTPAGGHIIEQVWINGVENTEAVLAGGYAFLNINANNTIEVSFEKVRFTMKASAVGNGNISPEGISEIPYGEDITYTITPESGYEISKVLVNGTNMGILTSYTFVYVERDGEIEAQFTPIVGIDEGALEGFSIYSNLNVVYIVNKNLLPVQDVSIMDMYGRVVWQGKTTGALDEITLDVANGIYVVRITSDNQFTTTKVSIQR